MTTLDPRNQRQRTLELLREPTVVTYQEEGTYAKECLLTGPYGARRRSHTERLSVGLIGSYHLIDLTKEWLNAANSSLESLPGRRLESTFDEKRHKLLFPDFPGAPVSFGKTIVFEPEFESKITLNELGDLPKNNPVEYASRLEHLIAERYTAILRISEQKPDVVLVLLTDEMYDTCHITGDYHQKLARPPDEAQEQYDLFVDFDKLSIDIDPKAVEPLSHNFRARLKRLAMAPELNVPIQIIRERTIRGSDTQNLATRSWNLLTGLYYKAGEIPWILGGLDPKICFLGVSFYHKKTAARDLVLSSMSHLFANDFNSVILRGEQVAYDYALKSAVLDFDSAAKIASRALEEFSGARSGLSPERVVIHKTSSFTDEEVKGFQSVFSATRLAYDLVSITKSDLKVTRWGLYPVPRGTALICDDTLAHLYTKGFVPDLQTYPGSHVPSAFEIRKARGDSSIKQICSEVLALTKLNWNTADFCCGVPITVSFARNVGDVFKEFDETSTYEPSKYFRFYM